MFARDMIQPVQPGVPTDLAYTDSFRGGSSFSSSSPYSNPYDPAFPSSPSSPSSPSYSSSASSPPSSFFSSSSSSSSIFPSSSSSSSSSSSPASQSSYYEGYQGGSKPYERQYDPYQPSFTENNEIAYGNGNTYASGSTYGAYGQGQNPYEQGPGSQYDPNGSGGRNQNNQNNPNNLNSNHDLYSQNPYANPNNYDSPDPNQYIARNDFSNVGMRKTFVKGKTWEEKKALVQGMSAFGHLPGK